MTNFLEISKRHFIKTVLVLFVMSLITSATQAQDNTIHKFRPAGLNTWTPSVLLPRIPTDAPGPDSVVRTDFTITMSDGTHIDCLKWVPVRNPQPAYGYPTVIMVHGYGDNKETLNQFCHDQATYGYYTMTFSMRGQGHSGGLSNLISRTEANDFIQIVNFVKQDIAGGVQPDNILVMGGSQGGLVPMQAACLGLNVKTLISSVAPPNFASSWIENGTIKMTCLWTMDYTPDTARYTQGVVNMRNWIYANTKAAWDSLAYNMPLNRDFVTLLPNVTMPVLIEGSWQDKFFNADGWIQNIDRLPSTTKRTSYLGAVIGHGGEQSAAENTWHMNWFNNWFYETLFGITTEITYSAPYQYASTQYPISNGVWTFSHDSTRTLMKNMTTPTRLYFRSNNRLNASPQGGSSQNVTFKNTVTNNLTLQDAIFEEFTGTNFNNNFKIDSTRYFDSNPLTADMEWTGAPTIKLDYKSGATGFAQFNYQIYEVLPDGTERFINRANYTDRTSVKGQREQTIFKGNAHSHIFKAGNKVRIKLTNLDRVREDTLFFGRTNPYALPVMTNATQNFYLTSNSYIEFPTVTIGTNASSYFAEEKETTAENNTPYQFKLGQNFPNPFNPSTMIEYQIAKAGIVQIKIYDVLGREVQTLVNDMQQPGSYNITFNAQNLSSGIYFYRLVSSDFTDVKRMVLVK